MNENIVNDNTIIAFQIGRRKDGHFHNPGHVTYIGMHTIGDFLDDIYPPRIIDDSAPDDPQLIDDYETPDAEWTNGCGRSVELTNAEVKSGVGRINMDFEYDTTYTIYLKDVYLDSNEWDAIFRYDAATDVGDIRAYLKNKYQTN